jgi:hypothetical protein
LSGLRTYRSFVVGVVKGRVDPKQLFVVGRPHGRNATKNGRSFERNYAGAVTLSVVLTRAGSTPNGRT